MDSGYQVQRLTAPTLLGRFGVEVVCFQGKLRWCGGEKLDSFFSDEAVGGEAVS
jgi:hypothetical protein